jgi:DNA polymerase I
MLFKVRSARKRAVVPGEAYTAEVFREEWGGLEPCQWTDVQALAGDKSDNVPGVKGIGDKGAVALLQQFGTLERLLERVDEVRAPR